jgi:hypothetical protein
METVNDFVAITRMPRSRSLAEIGDQTGVAPTLETSGVTGATPAARHAFSLAWNFLGSAAGPQCAVPCIRCLWAALAALDGTGAGEG